MSTPAIEVVNLRKQYRTGFLMKRVDAVKDISFTVQPGQVFGFLGPNGAGKTTTIRTLMGLIRPSSGTVKVLGEKVGHRAVRARIGFLPESPYFYDYLTVSELLDLAGRLCGVRNPLRYKRIKELVELVGLEKARNVQLKKYSKGMLQRAGIAQALINDPELVVFDEPMSGLDPVGRKEVRDIIQSLRERGKTVFFSTHILADVEIICDNVAIIADGALRSSGPLSELTVGEQRGTDVTLRLPDGITDGDLAALTKGAERIRRGGKDLTFTLARDADVDAVLALARELGAKVRQVMPRHETLEEIFLRTTGRAPSRAEQLAREAAP
jgi:ABC-2 type transport system ATP-binding protein